MCGRIRLQGLARVGYQNLYRGQLTVAEGLRPVRLSPHIFARAERDIWDWRKHPHLQLTSVPGVTGVWEQGTEIEFDVPLRAMAIWHRHNKELSLFTVSWDCIRSGSWAGCIFPPDRIDSGSLSAMHDIHGVHHRILALVA